jgi:hypothetical protein
MTIVATATLSQQFLQARLLEVMVCGQCLRDASLLHQQKTHDIAERVPLVRSLPEIGDGQAMQFLVYPDDFQKRVVCDVGQVKQASHGGSIRVTGIAERIQPVHNCA